MSATINNVTGFNCGKRTTVVNAPFFVFDGIFSSDRASNVKVNSFYIYNTPAYASGANIRIWDGDYHNVQLKGVVESEVGDIVRDAANVSSDSKFDIAVRGTVVNDLLTSALSGAGHLVNNYYKFSIDTLTSNRLSPGLSANNQTTNFLEVQSKAHDCHIKGKLGTGGISSGFQLSNFAGYIGQIGTVGMSDVNGNLHLLSVSTAGKLLIDGTIVGTQV